MPAGSGETFGSVVRPHAPKTALGISNIIDGKNLAETFRHDPLGVPFCVNIWKEWVSRSDTSAGINIHDFARVILGQSPLTPITLSFSLDHFSVSQTETVIAVCKVKPVVHTPDQSGWLVLHITSPFSPFEPDFFLLGNAIIVAVEVFINIIGV